MEGIYYYQIKVLVTTPIEGYAFRSAIETHSEYNTHFDEVKSYIDDQLSHLDSPITLAEGRTWIENGELVCCVIGAIMTDQYSTEESIEASKQDLTLLRDKYAEYLKAATKCELEVSDILFRSFNDPTPWVFTNDKFHNYFVREE